LDADFIFERLARRLGSTAEAALGQTPEHAVEPGSDLERPDLRSGYSFPGLPGAIWIAADDDSAQTLVAPALAGFAQDVSGWLVREVAAPVTPAAEAACETHWARVQLRFSDRAAIEIWAGIEERLLAALTGAGEPVTPKTLDLLMDVELPVSISFGRAQAPLKDVLKLSTGSIVELNRSIGEPVEVIVNNCVIARGEVVVIEGNFGVRIQQVISRQERLRTLH